VLPNTVKEKPQPFDNPTGQYSNKHHRSGVVTARTAQESSTQELLPQTQDFWAATLCSKPDECPEKLGKAPMRMCLLAGVLQHRETCRKLIYFLGAEEVSGSNPLSTTLK
jgi:hypothetical protein